MRIHENTEIFHWNTKWNELPERIQRQFSTRERSFYKNLIAERTKWIKGCKSRHIKTFLSNLTKNDNYRVYIRSENGEKPFVYWFTSFVTEGDGISVRLPVKYSLPGKPPKSVSDLYKYIGGVDEKLPYTCGWLPPEKIRPLSEIGHSLKSPRAKECFELFQFGNGDSVGYLSGEGGVVFTHEDLTIRRFNIDKFIATYFGNFFKRRQIK